MTDAIQGLVTEAKKNKFSTIRPSLSDEDVVSVWDNVSMFIDKQMALQKGVSIPGLGTFTFSQKKLDVGNNKFILIQRPVFVLSEKFSQTHALTYTKHHVSGQIPVVPLNFAALSTESPFDRDSVEACVKEVLQALARSVAAKRNVEFTFNGIGRLQMRESKVKMKFYKEFINSMDGSGTMVDSMKDRPGTVDSVMSERGPSVRCTTSNTLILPRITQAPSGLGLDMPAIQEEAEVAPEAAILQELLEGVDEPQDPAEAQEDAGDSPRVDIEIESLPGDENKLGLKKPTPPPLLCRNSSRTAVPIAKATGVSFHDDLLPSSLQTPRGLRGMSTLSNRYGSPGKHTLSPLNVPNGTTPRPGLPEGLKFERSRTVDVINLRNSNPGVLGLSDPIPSPPDVNRPQTTSSCGHADAGQELCYLCHQRARRNVHIPFAEERKRREHEEDKLLQMYQHMKDTEAILEQQENMLGKLHENQKMAAFNLGVAEAVKVKKNMRETDFHPSYIFQRRPLTPPRFIKKEKSTDCDSA